MFSSWKVQDDFLRRPAFVQAKTIKPATRQGGPERLLLKENDFSLILYGLFGW